MKFKTNLKLLTAGVIFSSFTFAGNQEVDIEDRACLDKGACPKILELAKVGSLKAGKVSSKSLNKNIISTNTISITNKSKKGVTTIIAASSQGKKTSCGQFSLAGKATITVNVSCDVSESVYTLADFDGRSNAISFSSGSTPTPTPTPTPDFIYAFVTSINYKPQLGGLSGADSLCSGRAASSSALPQLSGRQWRAWLSTSSVDAIDRFTAIGKTLPIKSPDGLSTIGSSLNDITTAEVLLQPISQDEEGNNTLGSVEVWTGTKADGTKTLTGDFCMNWTTQVNTSVTENGLTDNTTSSWTETNFFPNCTLSYRLYCMEHIS